MTNNVPSFSAESSAKKSYPICPSSSSREKQQFRVYVWRRISCWLRGGVGGEGPLLSHSPPTSGSESVVCRLLGEQLCVFTFHPPHRRPVVVPICAVLSTRLVVFGFLCSLFDITWFVDFLFIHFGCGKSCSLISVVCFVLLRSLFGGCWKSYFLLTFLTLFRDLKGGTTTIKALRIKF